MAQRLWTSGIEITALDEASNHSSLSAQVALYEHNMWVSYLQEGLVRQAAKFSSCGHQLVSAISDCQCRAGYGRAMYTGGLIVYN